MYFYQLICWEVENTNWRFSQPHILLKPQIAQLIYLKHYRKTHSIRIHHYHDLLDTYKISQRLQYQY